MSDIVDESLRTIGLRFDVEEVDGVIILREEYEAIASEIERLKGQPDNNASGFEEVWESTESDVLKADGDENLLEIIKPWAKYFYQAGRSQQWVITPEMVSEGVAAMKRTNSIERMSAHEFIEAILKAALPPQQEGEVLPSINLESENE